ncbi:MAG: hypothetical protein QXG10_02385 [Candidatus Hadarchaeales archaeon]
MLRCQHRLLEKIKKCMIEGSAELRFVVVGVSGTIRGAKRKFLSESKILR